MFDALINRMQKLQALNIGLLFTDALQNETLQAEIIDLNQKQLYDEGVQADGTPTGDYAPITIAHYKPLAFSQGRDGRSDHITGKDTGETYDSMRPVIAYNAFTIEADDRNNIFKDLLPQGLGLTSESLTEIQPEICELIIEGIKERIFAD
jgi:hypothetical protein